MQTFDASYPVWAKIARDSKGEFFYVFKGEEGHKYYIVFFGDQERAYRSSPEGDDLQKWIAEFKDNSKQQTCEEDALALLSRVQPM